MFDLDLWKEILNSLKKNKMRSILTAFGVFWGIFMLVVMAGAGRGLSNGIYNGVEQLASNSFFIWANRTSEPYKGFLRGRYWEFNNDDVDFIKRNIKGADIVSPKLFANSSNNTVRNDRIGTFNIKGDYPEWNEIDGAKFPEGRWLNQFDILQKRKVCVIGTNVADQMFDANESPIGQYLRIDGIQYQVVGVLKQISNVGINGRADESIFIPFTTMQTAYNYGNMVFMMGITAKKGYSASEVEEEVMAALKQRNQISPTDAQAISHINLEKQFQQFQGLFTGVSILTWIVGIGTLLAGVIGVSNIMLVIIKERTQEIGIMRAIGATPRVIMTQVISESVFVTTVAGYLGLVFGVAALELMNKIFEMSSQNGGEEIFIKNPSIGLGVAIACLLILIISGAIAGMIPARRAIKIKPIDALRTE